jgi:pectate lyase
LKKKKSLGQVIVFGLILFTTATAFSQQLAFPGAEGFGRFATGGRGGSVYRVTNLSDSGEGSFRDAVSKPNRTVVFNVGGVINIRSKITVQHNITIAGQTAPGEGITIYGNGLSFTDANNSITRYIRVRMGIRGDSGVDAITIAKGENMIFDHVSVSWGRDETFSVSGVINNITIQNCIIAEGLFSHSAGGLIQTTGGISLIKNLYINNHTRNPKVKGKNQFVNNIIYNWRVAAYILGDSQNDSYANVTGNYFIAGPNTSSQPFTRGNTNFHIYATKNIYDSNRNGSLDGVEIPKEKYTVVDWQTKPYDYPVVSEVSPDAAFNYVLKNAGASDKRDVTDLRLINVLRSLGMSGVIISKEPEDLGNAQTAEAAAVVIGIKKDSDNDGIPDTWELKNKLDPKNVKDANKKHSNAYTYLEVYLNGLIK